MNLLDRLEETLCVDTSQMYAAGFSNGGGLTGLLACDEEVSQRLAAFAASSGAYYTDSALPEPLFSQCKPGKVPVPILEFHGNKDPVEHYDGKTTPDGEAYSIPEWLRSWAQRNKCPDAMTNSTTPLYGGNVTKFSWSCGGFPEVVVHYLIQGFGHGWPTTYPLNNDFQRLGPTYFNATPVVMDFFQKWKLDEDLGSRIRDEL